MPYLILNRETLFSWNGSCSKKWRREWVNSFLKASYQILFRIVISKDTLYEHNNTTRTGKIRMVVRFSPHLTVYNDSFTNKWCGDLLLFNKEGWKCRTPFFILLFIDIFKRRKINTNSSDNTTDVHINIKNVIFCKTNKTKNFPFFL